jgi:hypothetical protein
MRLAMFEAPDFRIELDTPVCFSGMYGLRRKTSRIDLLVDDVMLFEQMARSAGKWIEPAESEQNPIEAPTAGEVGAKMSREEWLRRKPDYVSTEDWMKFVPR